MSKKLQLAKEAQAELKLILPLLLTDGNYRITNANIVQLNIAEQKLAKLIRKLEPKFREELIRKCGHTRGYWCACVKQP